MSASDGQLQVKEGRCCSKLAAHSHMNLMGVAPQKGTLITRTSNVIERDYYVSDIDKICLPHQTDILVKAFKTALDKSAKEEFNASAPNRLYPRYLGCYSMF